MELTANLVIQIVSAFVFFWDFKSHIMVVLFVFVLVTSIISMTRLKISKTKNTVSLLKP